MSGSWRELRARIERQAAEIEQLKAENSSLAIQVAQLTEQLDALAPTAAEPR